MMLPTHAIVGLAVATPVALVIPEHATVALAGSLGGSILPDLDLYAGHRRTLHRPTGYTIAAVPAILAAGLVRTPLLFVIAALLGGAALHCRMDRYGGGLELEPWRATSDRGVYDHVRSRWRRPKRWIRYDGAPEDVLLAVVLGVPLVFILEAPFRLVVVAALAVAAAYGLLRRRLATLAPAVFGRISGPLARHVPERYRR